MIKNQFKQKLKSPLNLLWLILFPLIYKGLSLTLNNYNFAKKIVMDSSYDDNSPVKLECLKKLNGVSGYTFFAEGTTAFGVIMAVTLIVGIIYSARYIYDKNTGFGSYCITRKSYNKYFCANVLSTFVIPFVITFSILIIILAVLLIVFGAKAPSDTFCADLFYYEPFKNKWFSHPLIMSLISALNISLIAGIFSLIGLGCSAFIQNRFLISIVPFAVYLVSIIVPQLFPVKSAASRVAVYFFTDYLANFFVLTESWYFKSATTAYLIHIGILFAINAIMLSALYYKDNKQYIK